MIKTTQYKMDFDFEGFFTEGLSLRCLLLCLNDLLSLEVELKDYEMEAI